MIEVNRSKSQVGKSTALSVFVALFLAVTFHVEAQQPKKIPRIGYVSGTGDAPILGLILRHSGVDCETSVISKDKISWLSIATPRARASVTQASWPSSSSWSSMLSSSLVYQRSGQQSRRQRRFPLSW